MTWRPIALSRDVPEGTTRAVLLDGAELVIWRGSDGTAHVWEDRCPHRGMRLSFGFVRGTTLNCLYHGWQYGSGALCHRIPAHPDLEVPATIRANALAVVEAGGMIWSGADLAAPAAAPDEVAPVASIAVAAPLAVVQATLPATDGVARVPLAGGSLYLGAHPVSADRSMLHAVADPDVDLIAAWAWLRTLRDDLERELAA